jgi:hypothetical protein
MLSQILKICQNFIKRFVKLSTITIIFITSNCYNKSKNLTLTANNLEYNKNQLMQQNIAIENFHNTLCLEMGLNPDSENLKITEQYLQCRFSLAKNYGIVPAFGRLQYLKYQQNFYNLSYIADKKTDENIKNYTMYQKEFPICSKINPRSSSFQKCIISSEKHKKCKEDVMKKDFQQDYKIRMMCYKKARSHFPTTLAISSDKNLKKELDMHDKNTASLLGHNFSYLNILYYELPFFQGDSQNYLSRKEVFDMKSKKAKEEKNKEFSKGESPSINIEKQDKGSKNQQESKDKKSKFKGNSKKDDKTEKIQKIINIEEENNQIQKEQTIRDIFDPFKKEEAINYQNSFASIYSPAELARIQQEYLNNCFDDYKKRFTNHRQNLLRNCDNILDYDNF